MAKCPAHSLQSVSLHSTSRNSSGTANPQTSHRPTAGFFNFRIAVVFTLPGKYEGYSGVLAVLYEKTSMPKKAAAPPINHIIVGFSFPSEQHPNEILTGTTRHSIWLSMSSQLYARWVTYEGNVVAKEEAERMAVTAFELTDIYLKKLDLEVAKMAKAAPPPPPPSSPPQPNSPFPR
jgi:hypothetical protein